MIRCHRISTRLICWLFFATLAVGHAEALDSPQVAREKYDALKAKVESGDLNINWAELRLDAVVGGVDENYDWQKASTDGLQAFNARDYSTALSKGLEIVSHNIASGDGHFLMMVSYRRLGKQAEAEQQNQIVDKILQSILDSGNGQTPASAWVTVTPSEESFVLRVLGMAPKSQTPVNLAGHAFNKVIVTARDGTETTFWFNIDTLVEMTKRALSNKEQTPLPQNPAK
jgi:Domain of unknown function (DUF4919)